MRASTSTITLVQRAKGGDAGALDDLIARYHDRWLERFHGELGTTLRSLHSTHDIVQSALREAARDIGALRNEGSFFVWVTMIIKHKISRERRRVRGRPRRRRPARSAGASSRGDGFEDLLPPASGKSAGAELAELDEYDVVVKTICDLFAEYPRPMAAVVLRYLRALEVEDVMARLGDVSRRSAYLWIRQGLDLLKERLDEDDG